ncbi:hypothetical protein H8S95_03700 [Pontibacter sp. KCTC 32443]|uniref:hypothetical protein n=1 Tax=Pontibacter TaxID=323449 RepID=UPI00164E197F|nr:MULTISPECIES: hypothetical protein [Pontibacter]MBC5773156.1 hypothetical protein [Pontibacter sp. KCTC 32443]
MVDKTNLKLALETAREFIAGKIDFKQLNDNFPDDTDDKDINELFDLIEHQPKLGGFFGVSQETYDQYNQSIDRVLERLEGRIKE